jgi:PPM family protein phosphatase
MSLLKSAFATDPGLQREGNQDRVFARVNQPPQGDPLGLFIVCDGVGGSQGGQFASHLAVEAVSSKFADLFSAGDPRESLIERSANHKKGIDEVTQASDLKKLEQLVRESVVYANQVVHEFTLENPKEAGNAGTTIALAAVIGNSAVIANVGDSRTYILRDGSFRQISIDHSLVAGLVASGQIQPEEVFSHPQRNLIFRSLGHKLEIEVDTFVELLKPGDIMLLCSDGLWEMLQDEKAIAARILKEDDLQAACDSLVAAANIAGGADNISVVLVKFD